MIVACGIIALLFLLYLGIRTRDKVFILIPVIFILLFIVLPVLFVGCIGLVAIMGG